MLCGFGGINYLFYPLFPLATTKNLSKLHYKFKIKKTSDKNKEIREFLVDPIPNSPNQHHENCAADSQENY